ncbi:adenylate/guanylate cyclase domain-containing protein [Oceanibacterium hippocampi]|uniref:Adenylate cyclase 1 n=1 Tax=Oceanibacterium hippocampi TaxID=745714 RepID=A0A1Y5TBH3_9PROT|nr:adenylate/guanylate cyclase domain-containing protein [Oceanibacterium hippocampi]SLN56620.1 Adenylate cyclase 1 [Oceanibacterium hippocampi]
MAAKPAPDDFEIEEMSGVRLGTWIRLIALAGVAALLFYLVEWPELLFYLGCLLAFGASGVAQHLLRRSSVHRSWHKYGFVLLDVALLTLTITVSNPLADNPYPPQMDLRIHNFIYVFLIVSAVAFSYSIRLVLWTGLSIALCWSLAFAWYLSLPDTVIEDAAFEALDPQARLALMLDPHFIDVGVAVQDLAVTLIVTMAIGGLVWRSRRIALRQARLVRERTNLGRFFSPRIAEELARHDDPFGAVRRQPVAVLFCDVVGFTGLAEALAPDQVIALLQEVHKRIEEAVFAHDGTLDKYLGDGAMATFGTPRKGPCDALNALAAAHAMQGSMAAWNVERQTRGEAPVRLSVAIHHGEVVLGDVGSERRLEFAVVGDVVNVASRLEELTRPLDADIVISLDCAEAARAEDPAAAERLLAPFETTDAQQIRGRVGDIEVLVLRRS